MWRLGTTNWGGGIWAWTALLALAAPAAAGGITGLDPAQGTLGTEVLLSGDFADVLASGRKPRVYGTRPDTQRKLRFRVLEVTAGTIRARLCAVPGGVQDPAADKAWTLMVRARGPGAPAPSPGPVPFTTLAPRVLAVDQLQATPGSTLQVAVDWAGLRRPSVRLGTRRARVLHWSRDPLLGQAVLTVRVPRLPNGTWVLSVRNRVGSSPLDGLAAGAGLLTIVDSPVGWPGHKPRLKANLAGTPVSVSAVFFQTYPQLVYVSACDPFPQGFACQQTLTLLLHGEMPQPGQHLSQALDQAQLTLTRASTPGQPQALRWTSTTCEVELLGTTPTLRGTFHALLEPASGQGGGPLMLTGGLFRAPPLGGS